MTLMAPFLSVSTIDFFQRRRVGAVFGRDFARSLKADRASLFFGSLVGLKPPLKVKIEVADFDRHRLVAPVAMPATLTASRAARAIVNIRYLRISLYLSFAACPSWVRCRRNVS